VISEKYKCIHVHIPKCAGTAITAALFGANRHKHMRAVQYKNLLQDDYESYYSFAFVRNPYDRMVSFYEMLKRNFPNGNCIQHKKMLTKCVKLFGDNTFESFVKFVAWCNEDPDAHVRPFGIESIHELSPQTKWVCNSDGELLVNNIYKYECIQKSYSELCDKLECPERKNKLRRKNGSPNRGFYPKYYNNDTLAVFEDLFSSDLELFGYHF